jgi:hypothetical protein
MKSTICLVALSLALAACDKKEEPTSTPASGAGEKTSGATLPAAAQADTADIPTEADFEEEAEQQITAANMESELARLEKEIEAE